MAAALGGGAEHLPNPPLQPAAGGPPLQQNAVAGGQLRAGVGGSEDAVVEDTVVDPTSNATGGLVVRARAPPLPFGMPSWTPTPSTLVVGAGAGINPFPTPPPPPRTSVRPNSALATALVAAQAEYVVGQARLREAALAWEHERDATDALAKQNVDAEQLLTSPASLDAVGMVQTASWLRHDNIILS